MLRSVTAARKLQAPDQPSVDTTASPLEHAEEWEAEIDRRIAEHRAGRGKSFTLEEVQAEIRAKYGW